LSPTPTRTPVTALPAPLLPAVVISELLPVPRAVDWDGSGKANAADEWIELLNTSKQPVDLTGWRLETGRGSGASYRIPRGTVLRAGGILALYQRQTRLVLPDAGGTIRLVDRNNKAADSVRYGALGLDASYSRDAKGVWHADWPPSPGGPNLPPVPAVPGPGTVTATPPAGDAEAITPTATPASSG
jgi:hypothetical protein